MLNFSKLSLRRGSRVLLEDVSLIINRGYRVGVTGANGVGKSSLFALIRNQLHADSGEFSMPPNRVIAHVAQETPAAEQSAIDYVIDGDAQLREIEKQIEVAQAQDQGETLAHLYSQFEAIDGYSATARAALILTGLGFSQPQLENAVKTFSGGWRMRLNLAQALMCRSDLMLLDEPTNHLDLDAVIWLEDWLRVYQGTLLLISHDREFLDAITTHIAHIEQCGMTLYTGNYSEFEKRRAQQLAQQQLAYTRQQQEIARVQRFISRFGAKATKAKQAQSRVKALQRMELISAAHVDSPFNFSFFKPEKLPSVLLQIEKVDVGYHNVPLLKKINFTVSAGDRIGLLGHNGAGKSTLIKLLSGELKTLSGEFVSAKHINIAYFAQHQIEQLDLHASPLLHLQRLDPKATEQSLRNFLGGFAFFDDMATSPVGPLSGGEKARLVLALMIYQKPNLLLLDEPTNHLDMEMRHALTTALQEFEGAMMIVSHDRHLLRTVTDKLFLIHQGQVELFKGDVDDYRTFVNKPGEQNQEEGMAKPDVNNRKRQRQLDAEKRKQLQPLKRKLKTLEASMEKLTAEKEALQAQLSDNSLYEASEKQRLTQLLEQQGIVANTLEELEMEWLVLSEELEAIEKAQ